MKTRLITHLIGLGLVGLGSQGLVLAMADGTLDTETISQFLISSQTTGGSLDAHVGTLLELGIEHADSID